MFTLKYEHCMNHGFEMGLQKLCSHPFGDEKTLYNAAKIVRRYRSLVKTVIEDTKKLAEEYARRDDGGKFVMVEGQASQYIVKEGQEEAHKKAYEAMLDRVCEFDCHPVSLSQCVEAKLNPTEVADLGPILDL